MDTEPEEDAEGAIDALSLWRWEDDGGAVSTHRGARGDGDDREEPER